MIAEDKPFESAAAPVGHNSSSLRDGMLADQVDALKNYEQRRADIIKAAKNAVIRDRATVGDAGDIIRTAGQIFDLIDENRRGRTDPLLDAGRAVKAAADEFWWPVEEALDLLRQKVKIWTDAEDARVLAQRLEQEEEIRRLAALANPKAPPPPPIVVTAPTRRRKIQGDLGSTVSTKETASYRIVDMSLIPDHVMNSKTVQDAIISVARQTWKTIGPTPGVERTTTTDNSFR